MNRPGIEKRSEIDSIAISLEGVLRDLATKGTLPQKTFQTLLEKIPKSTDSERVYQGKLNAFKKILGIEMGKSSASKSQGNQGNEGKKLSRVNAEKILQESGGDVEKARKRARELGYEF